MTRELFSADQQVKPADLARGSAFLQLIQLRAILSCKRPAGPTRGSVNNRKLTASYLSHADAPIMSSPRAEQSPGSAPRYSYQGIQCDANPVPAEAVTTPVVVKRSYQYEM